MCSLSVILPLKRFSFGDDDEELRKLAFRVAKNPKDAKLRDAVCSFRLQQLRVTSASTQATRFKVFRRCKAAFNRRVQLVWRSADDTTGQLTNLPLTPEKLYRLVPDPLGFQFLLTGFNAAESTARDPHPHARGSLRAALDVHWPDMHMIRHRFSVDAASGCRSLGQRADYQRRSSLVDSSVTLGSVHRLASVVATRRAHA